MPEFLNTEAKKPPSLMFCTIGTRQVIKRIVLYSSTTLFEQLTSSDIETLLRSNIPRTLGLPILWNNMFQEKDQLMNIIGSGVDEMFWKRNIGLKIMPLR